MANKPDISDVLSGADRPLDLYLTDAQGRRMSETVSTTAKALWGGEEVRFTVTDAGTPRVVAFGDGETFFWQDNLPPAVEGDELPFGFSRS